MPERPIMGYLGELVVWFRARPRIREVARKEVERVERASLF